MAGIFLILLYACAFHKPLSVQQYQKWACCNIAAMFTTCPSNRISFPFKVYQKEPAEYCTMWSPHSQAFLWKWTVLHCHHQSGLRRCPCNFLPWQEALETWPAAGYTRFKDGTNKKCPLASAQGSAAVHTISVLSRISPHRHAFHTKDRIRYFCLSGALPLCFAFK